MKTTWKIEAIQAVDDLITQAKYRCQITDGDLLVETEGTWFFREPKIKVAFADVTQAMVIDWIKTEAVQNGKSIIEGRLAEQLNNLKTQTQTRMPWASQVFTPKI